mmetsp:Transcript_11427/g.17442  ORF Transcript_11427/g.17442 Transcript_11427/m.17442 type:complete len:121 (+) Transcript_11427:73-435(+)|eukprot:CAMPEP_0201721034 /NCGR_PEP_ID=MMETSP0593-20130828/5831_1 /ASSEMBLY_ACC=CAM_ASM_000672 /TAXON_ID=267983 /ORGANISM="Skeletonema japonicum, Strain CCMP2506" /LENGTH=120 /DNA_ID=CAMNT_0048211779 /DNA_START=32 /DNA_END=394 /DNA_ORIENTATION=-
MTHSSILIATIVILSVIQLSTSFIPSTQLSTTHQQQPSTSTSAIYAKKKGRQTNVPKPLPTGPPPQDINLPEDATMEQLLDVLGETRLKKMARKNRRSRNQQIREGKVVLNERGEWVERD